MEFPYDLKNFSVNELKALCKELRADIIHAVSKTGGMPAGLRFFDSVPDQGRKWQWKEGIDT